MSCHVMWCNVPSCHLNSFGVVWKQGFFLIIPWDLIVFFSSLSFHKGPTSFAPNIIVFRSGPLKGWIVLASLFRVFWSSHQCNTLACADAGPICQVKPINFVFIFCRWVGKMTVVKLEWRLLGFAWIFFCCVFCCLAHCPGKNEFWVGEIIFQSWRVAAAGICWDWQTAWKKVIFGLGKSFSEIGEWRLLGFTGIFFFAVSILLLARLPGKESGGCWDLLGFLLLGCLLLFGRVPGKKMIFGWGKWFFWNWRVAIAGICWDFFFCGVYCCLAGCPAKKWFLGLENHFCEIGEWRLEICWDFSFFALSIAAWPVKLESGDCWDLLGFLLLRCPGKKWFLGRENHVSEAIAGICWDFSFFALSTATWQTARKKMIFGFFWNWRVAIAGICWDFFFYGVDCCLAGCPEKKWFLGRENHFSEVGD